MYAELIKNSSSFEPKQSKEIKLFAEKLSKYDLMPLSPKDFQRMQPYSNNEHLVKCIIKSLQENTPLFHDVLGFRPFVVNVGVNIDYWYCIILLLYSKYEEAKEYVNELILFYTEVKPSNLPFLHVILSNSEFKNNHCVSIDKMENYFVDLNKNKDYTIWADKIGIEFPKHMNWEFLFVINTEGSFVFERASENKPFQITVCIEPRMIDIGFYEGARIEVTDYGNRFQINKPTIEPTLLNLEEYILEIKNNFGIYLNPKIVYKSGFGYCKNKSNIQKWLSNSCSILKI